MGEVPIYERAIAEVEEQFDLARDYATEAVNLSKSLLESLTNIGNELRQIDSNVTINDVDFNIPPFTGIRPEKPEVSIYVGSPPAKLGDARNIDLSDLQIPDISGLVVHTDSINSAVATYESPLLTALKVRLLADIQLDIDRPNTETAKWNRSRERDLLTHQANLDRIRAEWSQGNLPLPDGVLTAAIEVENIRYANSYDDRSREIAIAESDLAVKIRDSSIGKAVQLEGMLMTFLQTTQQRIFEASRATVEAQLQVYNAEIMKYRMLTDIYQALANVRIAQARAYVDTYVAEVTAFRAVVEAEVARVDAIIKNFMAEVDAYKADTVVYQALSSVELGILKSRLDVAVSRAELYLKNADIQIRQYEALNGIRVEVVKAMGIIVAQQVAGALSSIQARASMSRGDSASVSYTHSYTEEE